MIVAHHYGFYGGFNFLPTEITAQKLWVQWLLMGGKIGVNLFMLISGYFMINLDRLNFSKLLKYYGQVFFMRCCG